MQLQLQVLHLFQTMVFHSNQERTIYVIKGSMLYTVLIFEAYPNEQQS
jgi:hypothetical protein